MTSVAATKACSGRCKGAVGCAPESGVWVLAASQGKVALFRKQADGHLLPLDERGCRVSSFEGGLRNQLIDASEAAQFSQLVLVGSANDIAWMQVSLPVAVSKLVVAEIEYPLIATWFCASTDKGKLTQVLEHVFNA